jgi:protein gp37
MSERTSIEWCDSTVNPSTGCGGCELWGPTIRTCYAGILHENRLAKSFPALYASSFQAVRRAPGRMMQAARWRDLRGKPRPDKPWLDSWPRVIFVGDMGDFLSRELPDEYIFDEIFGAILSREGQRHFWMLLTKRPERLAALSKQVGKLPDNCMAMTTVTNQHTALARIPALLEVKCLWRGISAEPMLGPIDISAHGLGLQCESCIDRKVHWCSDPVIHWGVIGGESGPGARPMNIEWARSLAGQCDEAAIPYFIKQLGSSPLYSDRKGGNPMEWPEDLRIRQMPKLGDC